MNVTNELKIKVWDKGRKVEGYDPNMFRKDACGAWIMWNKYGVQDNLYGWQIDHICPVSRLEKLGFTADEIDDIRNLRPLQHENNASKEDDYPSYTSVVTSEDNKNVHKEKNLTVNEKVRMNIRELYNI